MFTNNLCCFKVNFTYLSEASYSKMEGENGITNFTGLAKTLKKVTGTARKIAAASIKIMGDLQNDERESNQYVEDVLDALADNGVGNERLPAREDVLDELRAGSLRWIEDAQTVIRESPHFIVEEVIDGKIFYSVNTDAEICPFLSEVWNGDQYDKTGVEGLKELLLDLETQLGKISSEELIAGTVIFFTPQ